MLFAYRAKDENHKLTRVVLYELLITVVCTKTKKHAYIYFLQSSTKRTSEETLRRFKFFYSNLSR